jgi:hypothetical protein
MNRPIRLVIDRLVLTDVPMTEGRARRLRGLVESELVRLLGQQNWPESAAAIDLRSVEAAPLSHIDLGSDLRLAAGVAQGIVQSVQAAPKER